MKPTFRHLRLNYGQKIFLLASIPLVLTTAAIAFVVAAQARALSEREILSLETQLIEAKKQELRNYITQARKGTYYLYESGRLDEDFSKLRVTQILAAKTYGDEGFFFVYDFDGNNLVSPRQTYLINKNWWHLEDREGTKVVQEFVHAARTGAGFVEHYWPKPSTGEEARMITYVSSFPSWRWAVGTGIFIDDVIASVEAARAEMRSRIMLTFWYIGGITGSALLVVFISGFALNMRERRLADAKLKELTQRVFDAQEEERGRVARELHDGISQILVGVKFALDVARRQVVKSTPGAERPLDKGIDNLASAIHEVRRISRDLRPGILDDLGLGPALKTLTDEFSKRTGIQAQFQTVVFRNRLDQEARIALYRIAQEALTNVERHANASRVEVDLRGHRTGGTLRISDNGQGIDDLYAARPGIGLRNMQERIEQLGGSLRVLSSKSGTVIEANVPLTHMLPPESDTGASPDRL
ncbi:MAG: cache domain-containing protein [Pelagimonas sp.]|jgi:two-component system NarL family sensor kinase|nr:cache domain-containing protein [Pelagimonas sp.]